MNKGGSANIKDGPGETAIEVIGKGAAFIECRTEPAHTFTGPGTTVRQIMPADQYINTFTFGIDQYIMAVV